MAKRNISEKEYEQYFNRRKEKSSGGKTYTRWNLQKKTIIWASIATFLFAMIIYVIVGLPSFEELESPRPQLASKVFSADGELIGQFFVENRIEANIDDLPKHLIDGLIATEDRKFFSHWGVDLERFAKAMIKNIFTFDREGASTITQQLAKNLYQLKMGKETFWGTAVRKVREWITAVQLEKTYTKNEIIELYLNVSYFGRSAYGIETAAQIYFNKPAKKLTIPEAAMFIALLKSPENYDPIKNRENSFRRRNLVMKNMVEAGFLTNEKYLKLKEEPIELHYELRTIKRSIAPHFMEYVRQKLEQMSDKYGIDIYRDGLSIYTTIDFKMQEVANRVAKEHLASFQKTFNANFKWDKNKALLASIIDKNIKNSDKYKEAEDDDEKADVYNTLKNDKAFVDSIKVLETKIQLGFVALDPQNGQIKAMVGGANLDFGRGLNHVTGIRRQPGSSFKPIVYAKSLQNGYGPSTTISNEPFSYKGWSPKNSGSHNGGMVSMRRALALSLNVVSARMTTSDMAPPNEVVELAKQLGIKSTLHPYPSIALGTSEVVPLELISAYSAFANKGVYSEPMCILKIEDRNGILIDEFGSTSKQVLSPEIATTMTMMMKDVVEYGTGAGVKSYFHRPAAGKTGTTENYSDAWFIGFTPQYLAGCWVGFDDHRVKFTGAYGQGSRAAMPVWAKFMAGVYQAKNIPLEYFTVPQGLKEVVLCSETGLLANPACPNTYSEILTSGGVPAECDVHIPGDEVLEEDVTGDTGF